MTNRFGNRIRNTIYLRLLANMFFAIFFIMAIVGGSLYKYYYDMLRDDSYNYHVELLGQTKQTVEIVMHEIEKMAYSFALNNRVTKVVGSSWIIEEIYNDLIFIDNLFESRINSSNYIHSIYLYNSGADKVITQSEVSYLDDFFDRDILVSFAGGNVSSEWLNTRTIKYYDGSTSNVISYLLAVPITSSHKQGALIVNIKEEFLYDSIVNINKDMLGSIVVLDKNGTTLSYSQKDLILKPFDKVHVLTPVFSGEKGYFTDAVDGQQMFFSYITSNMNSWKYVTINPASEVFNKSNVILKTTFAVSGMSLFVGLLISLLLSRWYYKPVKGLVNLFRNYKPFANVLKQPDKYRYGNEFDYLRNSISYLMLQNEDFQQKIRENKLMMREHFLLNLLLGRTNDKDNLKEQLDFFDIDIGTNDLIVIVLHIVKEDNDTDGTYKDIKLLSYHIHNLCENVILECNKGIVINHDFNHYILILNVGESESHGDAISLCRKIISVIREQLKENFKYSVTAGIGNMIRHIGDIHVSYYEAVEALKYEKISGNNSTIHIDDIITGKLDREYVLNLENKIEEFINEVKLANAQTSKTIHTIIDDIFDNGTISYLHKNALLMQLTNSIVSLVMEKHGCPEKIFGCENPYHEILQMESIQKIKSWFEKTISDITDFIRKQRNIRNFDIINGITNYINDHYNEPITIQMMADKVYLNQNYLSKLFKDFTGCSFLEYLTKVRLDKACSLLKDSNLSISEIAGKTGFGNRLNLIRAFKKNLGKTPSDFRTGCIKEYFT